MKPISLIASLLFSAISFGQVQKTTTLELSAEDCRNAEFHTRKADTVFFFKLPEDTLLFKIIPGHHSQFPIKLENIKVTEYKVAFRNNFDQLVTRQIKLADQKINSIVLCPDSLLNYPQNTLKEFQENDSISIKFHSQGCFHTTVSRIVIRKLDGKYKATLFSVRWRYITKRKKTTVRSLGEKLLKTVTLTKQNIQDFIRFENELNFVESRGCTTIDQYNIKSKYLTKITNDGSCRWDGFLYLRKSFFGNVE